MYFRYYNDNNYYVLKLNKLKKNGLELYKKVGGMESLLGLKF